MTDVTVYIPIRKGYGGESYLLETTYDMDFLPSVGDLIHPCKNNTESGLTFEIHSRYWDEQGKVVLNIAKYLIDPNDGGKKLPRTWCSWYTDRDGDLLQILFDNGWWHYGEGTTNE